MMRCPECGFRAEDKTCPLCGVRMRTVSGATRTIQTHAHQQTGEKCTLPNQQQLATPPQQEKKASAAKTPPKFLQIVFFIILAVLLRACFGE